MADGAIFSAAVQSTRPSVSLLLLFSMIYFIKHSFGASG